MDALALAVLAVVGIAAGAASGLLGVGGGIVMVPALLLISGLGYQEAVSASLLVMVVATPVGLWRHARAGNVHVRHGLVLGAAGFAGVLVGEAIGRVATADALMIAFGVVLLAAARHLVYGSLPTGTHQARWILLLVGVAAGVVAKLFGIGGGVVMVPGLVFVGLGMHAAVGTSLLAVWTNAVLSTGVNAIVRPGAWWLHAVPLAVGSLVGVRVGAAQALRANADVLRRVFAIVLVYTAFLMMQKAIAP